MAAEYHHIRIDRHASAIAAVVVTRADIGNASSPEMLGEIRDAFAALSPDGDVRAIILAAEGKHFSVGADFAFLQRLAGMSATEVKDTVYDKFQGAARAIYRCPKPTLALVQGAAITVGCEIALACDFRVAADNAMFQESWIKLGIMPPLGGTFLLPRIIGLGRAMEMCLRGKQVRAEEALAIGLVSEVVAKDDLAARGLQLAQELAALAPLAYATVKQSMQRALESSMEAEWQANLPNQAVLLGSEDHREGLAAVTEKRTPVFRGR
ncbi:2-(1,2-epoxy-1,2-dihydrophenyl)acetyl-CoA isomerase [Sphingopyxis panaciterrae]|uniref:enoyl-CoA hydratase-related protein n=1 Tax=Sphingopyxis panaciterrae TaxID=363841 RepID=UPI0014209F8B|nr:2-(1,2-epoxy-1,2-dihydrophenyl)acetyl-CoA isomerase [Sphingopyxis panaciterrae]